MYRIIHALLLLLLATTVSADDAKPAIYIVHGKYNTLQLVGTIHLLQVSDTLPDNIMHAYQDTQQLLMEVDISAFDPETIQTSMLTLGMLPEEQTLATQLDAATYNKLKNAAQKLDIDMAMLDHFRPWFAALSLEEMAFAKLGYGAQTGIEMQLTTLAAQDHKTISGLETIDEQLNLFATLDAQTECIYLVSTLDELQDMQTELTAMVDAWRRGDETKLNALLQKSMNANSKLFKVLVSDRNHHWLSKLESLLDNEHDNYLVAVGALHLIGNEGVVNLLRQAGYKVTKQ